MKATLHQVDQSLVVIPEVVVILLHENKTTPLTKAPKDTLTVRALTTNIQDTREDLVAEAHPLPTDHVKVQKLGSTRKATITANDEGNVPALMKGLTTETMIENTLVTAIIGDEWWGHLLDFRHL